jgi:hypothetical protein
MGHAITAIAGLSRLPPLLQELPGLRPGALLRLLAQGQGWGLQGDQAGQYLPLSDAARQALAALAAELGLAPGESWLLRVRSLQPRLELQLLAQQTLAPAPAEAPDSGWARLSALRPDMAGWRRRQQGGMSSALTELDAAGLARQWAQALALAQAPLSPRAQGLWLMPQAFWAPDWGRESASARQDQPPPPCLSLLLRWRDQALALQLQGGRAALELLLLAEQEAVLAALKAELTRLVAALTRAGWRLKRLGWRRQALWVPADTPPPQQADAGLLEAASLLVIALESG